jgi:hypothetical protein
VSGSSGIRLELKGGNELAPNEAAGLRRAWAEQELAPGQEIGVGERSYRVLGFDPVSVRPRRLYVESLSTGDRYVVEIPEW